MSKIYGFHWGLCCWHLFCFTQHIPSHNELCQEKRKWSHCLLADSALQCQAWICECSRVWDAARGCWGWFWGMEKALGEGTEIKELEVTHKNRFWPVAEGRLWTDGSFPDFLTPDFSSAAMLFRVWFCEVRDWFQVFVFLWILKWAPKWGEDCVHPHDHTASKWALVLLSCSSRWHRHNVTPVRGHEEMEWSYIKGSSDWAAGKSPSPRGWSSTGLGSRGKWSQHWASRSIWTTLSTRFSFRWSCEEQGTGLRDAYGSLPTWDTLRSLSHWDCVGNGVREGRDASCCTVLSNRGMEFHLQSART